MNEPNSADERADHLGDRLSRAQFLRRASGLGAAAVLASLFVATGCTVSSDTDDDDDDGSSRRRRRRKR